MMRMVAIGSLLAGMAVPAAAATTDFGVRVAPRVESRALATPAVVQSTTLVARAAGNIASVAALAARWGRVTSTYRTPSHNRLVGGVPNSFHLSGRAIDIARRPGVRHAEIAAAFQNAGYRLIESLDERDHSHFAFDFGGGGSAVVMPHPRAKAVDNAGWKVVYAPSMRSR